MSETKAASRTDAGSAVSAELAAREVPLIVRIAILLAAASLTVGARIDQLVSVARETGWILPELREANASEFCYLQTANWWNTPAECLSVRLEFPVLVTYGVVSLIFVVATVFALLYFAGLLLPDAVDGKNVPPTNAVLVCIFAVGAFGAFLVGIRVAGAMGFVWRFGDGPSVEAAPIIGLLFWAMISFTLFVVLMLLRAWRQKDASKSVDWESVGSVINGQRANLVIIVVFAAMLLVIPLSVEQTGDALRALSLDGLAGVGQALFLIAGAGLLAATILEAWRVVARRDPAHVPTKLPFGFWLIAGFVVAYIGGVFALYGTLLPGLFVLAVLLGVVGVIEFSNRGAVAERKSREPSVAGSQQFERIVAATPLVILGIAVLVAGVDLWAGGPDSLQWLGPMVVGFVLLALALIATARSRSTATTTRRARWAAMIVVGALTLATVGLLILSLVTYERGGNIATVAAGVVAAVAMVYHLVVVSQRREDRIDRYGTTVPYALLAWVVIIVVMHFSPIDFPRTVGSLFLITVFLAGVVALGSVLTSIAFRVAAPGTLRWFGLVRFPVLSVLLVWWILAGVLANPNLHTVRTIPLASDRADTYVSPGLEEAFDSWVAAQPEFAVGVDSDAPITPVVPLVLVTSHGGGIRAAYWTALVLDCVVGSSSNVVLSSEPTEEEAEQLSRLCTAERREGDDLYDAASRIFLASGVSGGAVGLGAYSVELTEGDFSHGWVSERLDEDFLSPVLGWALFHDLPNHLVGLAPGPNGECVVGSETSCVTQDRAAVLEESFARMGEDEQEPGLRASWLDRESDDAAVAARAQALPILVFNSATTGDPFRAVTSPVSLGIDNMIDDSDTDEVSGAADVGSMLCDDRDLTITTASILAARFPIVSPSGVVGGECSPGTASSQLADGGYLENSGAQTILELLPELTALVEEHNAETTTSKIGIVVIDIDNEYQRGEDIVDTSKPIGETLLPAQIILNREAAFHDAALAALEAEIGESCFVTIAPELLPGLRAPLGWTLSNGTQASLEAGLTESYPTAVGREISERVDRIRQLQNWLEPFPQGNEGSRYEVPLDPCVPGYLPPEPVSADGSDGDG